MNRKYRTLAAAALVAAAAITIFAARNDFGLGRNMEITVNMMRELSLNYVDEVDPDKLMEGAAAGMVSDLDPYTEYIPEKGMQNFELLTTGKYGGIGALIRQKEDYVRIAQPYQGSPADLAGLRIGDKILAIDGKDYTVGAIVMSNFGGSGNLVIGGDHIGKRIKERMAAEDKKDLGSIIMIIATDAPISDRQLRRVAKRATVSLGRCGSYLGNGSGDIAVAFSTGNRVPHYTEGSFIDMKMMDDEKLDVIFESAVEAVEESVISSMYHAKTTKGVRGNIYYGLREFL